MYFVTSVYEILCLLRFIIEQVKPIKGSLICDTEQEANVESNRIRYEIPRRLMW